MALEVWVSKTEGSSFTGRGGGRPSEKTDMTVCEKKYTCKF